VSKIRINPGNMGGKENLMEVINKAKSNNVPIRIGINHGSIGESLDKIQKSLTVVSEYISFFESYGFYDLVISLKSSSLLSTIKMNEEFSLKYNYPLHLGITEAGFGDQGIIKSSAGLAPLLLKGIGDTVRMSLTGDPVKEIGAVKTLLRSLEIRKEGVEIISCPTCGRTEIGLERLAKSVSKQLKGVKKYIKVAVMGCIVNGPGEAQEADYAICGTKDAGYIYKKGEKIKDVPYKALDSELLKIINSDKL
jgi:(E)-4-hydroxy-3-methylbut-2-enyl-diphosphate synthase